ncbi:MAG: carboxypeptidase regulatory-like domain-containing protein, partial [Planctomycetota bacterium]
CGVTGVVVDDEGTPMAGVPLKLFTWHRPDMRYDRGREVTGQSAEDGSFSLRGVLPGEAGVNASPEDALPRRVDLGVLADGDLVEDLELRLDRGGVLTGVVVWFDGEPANGVDVYVAPLNRPGIEAARDRTDREGRFEASGLRGDAYVVTAVGQRNRRGPFLRDSVRTGRSGRLELKLGDGLAVRGRAVDDAGAPLRDLRVVAEPLDEPGEPLRRRFRDDGGVFEFTGLGPGRWDISVHAKDHGSSLPRRVTLPGASDALEFVLLRHGSLGGTVKGTDGAPVAGARVAIGALRTETGPEGRFAFDSLPPGQHVLDVTAAGYGPPADPHVRVVPGAPEEDHVVLLTRGGRILGRIHPDRWTGKETGVLLRVAGAFAVEAAPVDQEGRFRFEGLAGGSYLVRLDGSNADHWADRFTESLEVPVEVPENGDVRVVLGEPGAYGVTVHGTVRRGGEPTAGLLMYVYKTDEEVAMPRQITRTDEQGRYEVSFRQTGLHSFCVGEGQAKQARFDVVLTDEARQSHDFDMPERSLRGQVRLVGGAPAGGQQLMLTHADVPSDAVMVGHTAFTYTGADGTFEFTDLHPGAYRLRTGNYVQGHATRGLVVVEDVVVPEEGDAAELDLFLPEAATVDARAVDAAGQGLVDRKVE